MEIELLEIENDKVVPGIACYTIKELKQVMDNYDMPAAIEIYTYIRFLYHHKSPFRNFEENTKEQRILESVRSLDWDEYDEPVVIAKKFCKNAWLTPARRFMEDAKAGLEKLGKYMREAPITDGKDGNFAAMSVNYTRIGKTMEDFKKLEKIVEDEQNEDLRGGGELSYDQQ